MPDKLLTPDDGSGSSPLGNSDKNFPFTLTEPEISAIHFVAAMFKAEIDELVRLHPDYGPTPDNLSKRLEAFDDDNASSLRADTPGPRKKE